MCKIAIIGASYLQEPLIRKAKKMGIETHVFAWAAGDIGEEIADFFYPISIIEKEEICEKCREIGIDGVCSIASDLAAITVNYVANQLNLVGNSEECVKVSTNKHFMRNRFKETGVPSPISLLVESIDDVNNVALHYPVIVKPIDRSGSRGITKVVSFDDLSEAIENAKSQGFEKKALVEEFATGQEYSVEYISWKGKHFFLNITKKYTTGAPNFIETGHVEPATLDDIILEKVKKVVIHALDALDIRNGASHTELKISKTGEIAIIEIGGRMGGDCIGSHLVQLTTGIDFVRAVIQIALGREPDLIPEQDGQVAAVRFVFSEDDILALEECEKVHPEYIILKDIKEIGKEKILDSSSRFGYFILASDDFSDIEQYMPGDVLEDEL